MLLSENGKQILLKYSHVVSLQRLELLSFPEGPFFHVVVTCTDSSEGPSPSSYLSNVLATRPARWNISYITFVSRVHLGPQPVKRGLEGGGPFLKTTKRSLNGDWTNLLLVTFRAEHIQPGSNSSNSSYWCRL